MPLYEYRCQKCGTHFEKIQKFSDPPFSVCERCRGKLERLLSSPAIQFKGSGWYITDYAKKAPASPGEKPSASSDGKGESTTTEKPKKTEEPSPTKK